MYALARAVDFCNVPNTMKSAVFSRRVATAWFVLVVVWGAAFPAAAGRRRGAAPAGGSKRVAISLKGTGAGPVAKQIEAALKGHGLVVVPAKQVGNDAGQVASAVRRLKAVAAVTGEVRDNGTRAQIQLHGAEGGVLAEGSWSVAGGQHKLAAAVGRSVWSRFGRALEAIPAPAPAARRSRAEAGSPVASSSPPARSSLAMESTPPPGASDAEGSEFGDAPVVPPRRDPDESLEREGGGGGLGAGAGPAALDVAVGPRLLSRDLSWNKPLRGTLSPVSAGGAAAVGFAVAWYPGAHFTRGWATRIGLVASGEYTPSSDSQANGATYATTESDYWGGVRGRIPFESFDGSLTVGYGQHGTFIGAGTNAPRSTLAAPDVAYSYLRLGADLRVSLPARFALMAGLAYRHVLSAGTDGVAVQSDAYFPRATLTAMDANVAIGFRITQLIEARLGADLRRYGFDMHPQPATDPVVVSGAIDQYVAYWLNLAVMLGGKS